MTSNVSPTAAVWSSTPAPSTTPAELDRDTGGSAFRPRVSVDRFRVVPAVYAVLTDSGRVLLMRAGTSYRDGQLVSRPGTSMAVRTP